jgi:hypothetical protein
MFTIEQKKELRVEFWLKFKAYSNKRKLKAGKQGKWIMDQTGIKQLKLKFHFDENTAWAGIEVDTTNLDKRIVLFDKLEQLKALLSKAVPYELTWELEAEINPQKTVSRIYSIKPDVSVYNKKYWQEVFVFLYEVMDPIEDVYLEYFDFIKY